MSSPSRELADRLVGVLLAADPFSGSALGLREYDALVPDPSAAADAALDAQLAAITDAVDGLTPDTAADRVTAAAVRATCVRNRLELAGRAVEHSVTPMPFFGPPAVFGQAARTVLVDARAAADYLTRARGLPAWMDAITARLGEGAAAGRFPVGSLVDQTVVWAREAVDGGAAAAFAVPAAPADLPDPEAWRAELDGIVSTEVLPALTRWYDALLALRPSCRSDDDAGLGALPGGAEDYRRAVAIHTTLDLDPDDLHELGLREVDRLQRRALELGARIGLDDLPAVVAAARASSSGIGADVAIERARATVARAEQRVAEIMPGPHPAPCAVEPMPATVASAGVPPHYTRPRRDGSRPGTYWFNTERPTVGTGWDLEAVAFHEAVPGHHSQLGRAAVLPDLPLLQQVTVTVHAEGWGLYAERLAGEFGLYSGETAELGAVYCEMHRAARLVVDTGLHARGWSRSRARDYLVENLALPESFLADETDRYIAWPGQALAYYTGLREILRLREQAEQALGATFDLPQFNAALLDSGSVPMPVLAMIIEDRIADWGAAG